LIELFDIIKGPTYNIHIVVHDYYVEESINKRRYQ